MKKIYYEPGDVLETTNGNIYKVLEHYVSHTDEGTIYPGPSGIPVESLKIIEKNNAACGNLNPMSVKRKVPKDEEFELLL